MVLDVMVLSAATIALAELADKSHVITLLLGAKYKDRLRVFIGAMAAFLIAITLAVVFGSAFSDILLSPSGRLFAGLVLIIFGIYTFLSHEDGPVKIAKHSPFISAFVMILIAEMGDKSQFTTAYFGAAFDGLAVIIGMMLGLGAITYATIFISSRFNKRIRSKVIHSVAGTIFVMLGLMTWIGVY